MSLEFVDTNVLIYAHDASAGTKRQQAIELIRRLAMDRSGSMSVQVLVEFYAAAVRKLQMDSHQAEREMADLGAWTLHRPSHADILRAAEMHRRLRVAWWDALILNSAIELGCETLWSEDFRDGQRVGGVTVRNPFR